MSLPSAAASKYGWSPGLTAGSRSLRSWYGVAIALLPFHDQCGAAVPVPERTARAVRKREVAILHLDFGVRLAAQLTHRFDDLGHAAAVRRVVVAQSAAVGVERQLAGAGDEVAVRDEFSACAFLAEAEIQIGRA